MCRADASSITRFLRVIKIQYEQRKMRRVKTSPNTIDWHGEGRMQTELFCVLCGTYSADGWPNDCNDLLVTLDMTLLQVHGLCSVKYRKDWEEY
jgi:hypothetical protein